MAYRMKTKQAGVSLVGLIVVLGILFAIGVLAMKVFPTVSEFYGVRKAIVYAKNNGASVREIQAAFDRQASVAYIDSISGRDLVITKSDEGFDVSFEYQKKIPLMGPASLVLDYTGTTAAGKAKGTRQIAQ